MAQTLYLCIRNDAKHKKESRVVLITATVILTALLFFFSKDRQGEYLMYGIINALMCGIPLFFPEKKNGKG